MIAARRQKADIGPHGQPMSEATSPLAHPGYHGPGSYHYRVIRSEDYAAKAMRVDQEMFRKQNPDASNLDDYVWAVVKEPDPRATS